MAEQATVTITADEYFELRSKAETNLFLTTQLGQMDARIIDVEKRLWELEGKMHRLEG